MLWALLLAPDPHLNLYFYAHFTQLEHFHIVRTRFCHGHLHLRVKSFHLKLQLTKDVSKWLLNEHTEGIIYF